MNPAGEWYELSDFLGPQRREQLLRRARIVRIIGFVLLGATVLGVLRWLWAELPGGLSLRQWLFDLPAGLCCGGALWLIAFGAARSDRRAATRRVLVGGSRLLVIDLDGRREFDLATAESAVELRGLTGKYRRGYPVLTVRPDPKSEPFVLELAQVQPEALRTPQDMMLLAGAVRANPAAQAQDTAGRLHTLAGWRGLPLIQAADADAIPVTPLGATAPAPAPIRHGGPAPEVIVPPPARLTVRHLLVDVLLIGLAALLVLVLLTIRNGGDPWAADGRAGLATTVTCERTGPVSGNGLGFWYDCVADVRWDDDSTGRITTGGSVLRPADIGRPVGVREKEAARAADAVYRATEPPSGWVGAGTLLILVTVLALLAFPIGHLVQLGTRRRRATGGRG